MKKKKLPFRMCIGCREMMQKKELLRVVRSPEGDVAIDDLKGKSPGRGAYICLKVRCFEKIAKTKMLERVFGQRIEPATYELLKHELSKRRDQHTDE